MRFRSERGQALALTAVSITVLVAVAAFVLDVGSWYRAHRHTQAIVDASALAGAQKLPGSPDQARALALRYAAANGGGVSSGDIAFSTETMPNDTISVKAKKNAPGLFAKLFGIDPVGVSATAKARAFGIAQAQYSAPFAVDRRHPDLSGPGCPCFGQPTTLDLNSVGPGAFKVLDLDGSQGGIGQQTLAEWILEGYGGDMPLGWYYSDPGAKFNPQEVQSALDRRIGDDLLFPIYDQIQKQGANFQYDIVGWVGFHLTGYDARGNNSILQGYFTHVVWTGIESTSSQPYFGAAIVKLVE